MSNRKDRVAEQMRRLESGGQSTAGTELAEAQAGISGDESPADAGEVSRRLQMSAEEVLDPPPAPAPDASNTPAPSSEAPAAEAPKRKGGWPKGKPRTGNKAPKVAPPKAPAPKKMTPKEDRSFQTPATLAARAEAAEKRAAALELQLAGKSSVSDEEIADLRYEIEGLLITAQAIGRQRFGEAALLSEEQSLAIQRMWVRPFERALRFLAKRSDDGKIPVWVLPAIQLTLAMVGTVAVLFPNWMRYVDEQEARKKLSGAQHAPHVDEPAPDGAPAGQAAEVHEIPDDPRIFPDFIRPRGAEGE